MAVGDKGVAGAPVGLKCEYAVNPVGIDEVRPRFSWRSEDGRRGARQTGYRVRVGTKAGEGDMWDSGKVESDRSVHVMYGGEAALRGRVRYFWQVKTWDQEGVESGWSEGAFFEMGMMGTRAWKAQWVSVPQVFDKEVCPPAKYLRRNFVVRRAVKAARLYITAKGIYVPYLNGKGVGGGEGGDVFTPGWSDYRKRIRYQTYDVTGLVGSGRNVIAAAVGEGWYTGNVAWQPRGGYGENTALLAELHLDYADGSYEVVRTDGDWKGTSEGPIRSNDFLMGERFDARQGLGAWNGGGEFDDAGWTPVRVEAHDKTPLEAYVGPTVQKMVELVPREAWRTEDGRWIFDLGQNMVGWARLKVKGGAGQEITLRFAEVLNPNRTIYTANLRKAKATDVYVCKGGGVEEWEPLFTYHGFRYVEVSGLVAGQTPGLDTVTGVVTHSATAKTGSWKSSSELLNQLQHNIEWGQRGNFVEIPTDCPQRDERLGWMGDAQVFVRTATYNMDVAGFFTRWMVDVDDAQREDGAFTDVSPNLPAKPLGAGIAAWADAGVVCPWTIYRVYGDERILERHYDAMRKYIAFMLKKWPSGLRHDGEWTYGDWLAIDSWTPRPLIGCAYFAYSVALLREIATILKKEKDAARYGRLFEKLKKTFSREFVTVSGYLAGDSQTAYVLALRFGLLAEDKVPLAIKRLTRDIEMRGVLTTGFVGVNLLLPTLSQIGRDDLAYKLLTNEKFPSWLYSVKNGATTIWERWDGWTTDKGFQHPGMNSFNHYAYGSCGEWMYGAVAGIELDAKVPGFKHIVVQPRIGGGLTSAEGRLETGYGVVEARWRKEEGGKLEVMVRIPANTTATVALPASGEAKVRESGKALGEAEGIGNVRMAEGLVRMEVSSGAYQFVVEAAGRI